MAAKLTTLSYKIVIQLHLVTEYCTICNSRPWRPVRKPLDTPSLCVYVRMYVYTHTHTHIYMSSASAYHRTLTTLMDSNAASVFSVTNTITNGSYPQHHNLIRTLPIERISTVAMRLALILQVLV